MDTVFVLVENGSMALAAGQRNSPAWLVRRANVVRAVAVGADCAQAVARGQRLLVNAVERLLVIVRVALLAGRVQVECHLSPISRFVFWMWVARYVGVAHIAGKALSAMHRIFESIRVNVERDNLPVEGLHLLGGVRVTAQADLIIRSGGRGRRRSGCGLSGLSCDHTGRRTVAHDQKNGQYEQSCEHPDCDATTCASHSVDSSVR